MPLTTRPDPPRRPLHAGSRRAGGVIAHLRRPPQAADTLLSQGRPVTASSQEGDAYAASAAVDGNLTGTRCSSAHSDPQWIRVDLGAPTAIRKLQLVWDPAYAKSYEVQVSDDGSTWRTVHSTTTNAASTIASLYGGRTTCKAPADASAYWMPSLYNGDKKIFPVGPQVIYYKAGVTDYTSVRPFPKGLRFVVGDPMQSADEFRRHRGFVEGWECGDGYFNIDIPASCPSRPDVQLDIRMRAPSCWDGKYLDTPDHRSHMAYPVVKPGTNDNMCPASHPVALPMIEFKMAFPVNGDMSQVRLAGGRGYSFHYDFFNAWEERTLKAMVDHCIVGGLQCDAHGYDETNPQRGAALNADYRLP
ncbi:DUF1996 domain-containing protein [Streptomyces macrosporus]|uniref:DUF1996 domain-containing protein n=1 Tax=Streptomyces macrosporus TaxID=44032 RepID=UPI003CD09B88